MTSARFRLYAARTQCQHANDGQHDSHDDSSHFSQQASIQAAVEAANADLFGDISRLWISAHDCGGQISEHPPENYN